MSYRVFWFLIAGLVSLCGAPLMAAPAEVPLKNPSFEEGVDQRGTPLGWQRYAGGGQGQRLSLVDAPEGGKALLIEDGDPNEEIGITQTAPARPEEVYRASVRVWRVGGADTAGAYLQLRFLPSQKFTQVALAPGEGTAFREVSATLQAPAGTTRLMLYLYTHKAPTPKVMVDDVKVESGVELPPPAATPAAIPQPVVPVYDRLKELHLRTALARGGKPAITIAVPERYQAEAAAIQAAIREVTGVTVPVVSDTAPEAAVPLKGNLLLLGNRSTNRAISALYDLSYTFLDRKYPGPGGYVVRSLHSPFGDGRNVLFAGGSDDEGVHRAADALVAKLRAAGGTRGELSVGWLTEIRLGRGLSLPKDVRRMEIWEASRTYGSSGYFGWNILSKLMAAYYMTGEEWCLREFLRYAFPDARAIKELEEWDGERVENKSAPLSGPYHYSAHMMILLWDLIEESPLLSDADRLRITNAFAGQLPHRVVEGVYGATSPPAYVGDRHRDWSAVSLYCLGRYFQKDYPSPVWQRCMAAVEQYFSTLRHHHWMANMNDHLFWYTSFYDPMLNYMILSGDRTAVENGNLVKALRTQEILSTGLEADWGLKASSLSFLHKAAYLTGDGRWLYYRERTGLDTDCFRLGQSFWPGEELKPKAPEDLVGRWTIQAMPEPMWRRRDSGVPLERSFRWGSYRSSLGPGGDLVMIKGYNGAGRLPYHTCVLMELRLNGVTLLQGYRNQILASADGMVEPQVPLDGALLHQGVLGEMVSAVMEVPRLPFSRWRRSLAQRVGRYALIVDDLTFRTDSDNMKLEVCWEMPGAKWDPEAEAVRLRSQTGAGLPPGWIQLPALKSEKVACGPGTPAELLSRLHDLGILLLKAPGPGTWVETSFTLAKPFRGEVYADLLNYCDRGRLRFLLDGRPAGKEVDHYDPDVVPARVSLGIHALDAGEHVLRVEVTGKRPEATKHYVGLTGVSLRPEGAPAQSSPAVYELRTSEPMPVTRRDGLVMEWRGPVRDGGRRFFFHLLGRNPEGTGEGLACARVAENAAALALPEPALAVAGSYGSCEGDLVVLADTHLYARAARRAGLKTPLLAADQPVDADWDFASGELHVEAGTEVSVHLALAPGRVLLDGKPVAGQPGADGLLALRLSAGRHVMQGARPRTELGAGLAALLAEGRQQRAALSAALAAPTPKVPEWQPAVQTRISGKPSSSTVVSAPDGPLLCVAVGKAIHLLGPDGKEAGRFEADAEVRVVHWWPEAKLLLAGCVDEKVIAFDLRGQRRWSFTSEMDRAVYEAGKQYWFKSAHPGIYGLSTGRFVDGKSQCFVGSACTLEILDMEGKLVKRLPIFWGPGRHFLLVDAPDGSRNLLVARWRNDSAAMAIVNSKTLTRTGTGFYGVPNGHTFVGGWDCQNRDDNYVIDLDGDGKVEVVSAINGTWNRVTVWNAAGEPLHNAQFGPGSPTQRANLRGMDVADLDGDGRREIIVGTSGGLVVTLDHQCRKEWSRALPSPPVVLRHVSASGKPWIIAGTEDGTMILLNGKGEIVRQGRAAGRPAMLQVVQTAQGPLALLVTETGSVAGFQLGG
ncbi:MAG TPA: VCBS repeat-containing protein [Armatimonadetes bacterium]|nr:VCBS repeat-containing protein [Armatimonadota bacterium]